MLDGSKHNSIANNNPFRLDNDDDTNLNKSEMIQIRKGTMAENLKIDDGKS